MIEEFNFGNFWSFKEQQTLNMTASKIKSNNQILDSKNIIEIEEKLPLIKSKAIYGANASGKTNVIKALVSFIRIISTSVKDDNVLSILEPFKLSIESVKQPTFFQLVFRIKNVRYRYGFEADEESIKSEWLFYTPKKGNKHYLLEKNKKFLK